MLKFLFSLFMLAVVAAIYATRNCAIVFRPHVAGITTIYDYMNFTAQWEGKKRQVYKCPAGYATIGIGHRLKAGENYLGLTLSDAQIEEIFKRDMIEAYVAAKTSVKDFDSLPHEVKLIVVDANFNLGKAGFRKFQKTIAACDARDWKTMAEQLRQSKWFSQTGNRAKNHVSTLKRLAA